MTTTTSPVVIGMDPHKRSVTIEIMDPNETVLGRGRFTTDQAGFTAMLKRVGSWPQRVWAIEGSNGAGRPTATRLATAGETVVDVPTKLSARVRVYATGNARKTDDTDAHAIALAGVRVDRLQPVVPDETRTVLRILSDRRRALATDRTRTVAQLHHLLSELVPGGAPTRLSATRATALVQSVQADTASQKMLTRMARELIDDIRRIDQRKHALDLEITELVDTTGTRLRELRGIGPLGAAWLLVEVGDITRFPSKAHFASWNGTAPIDASSGAHTRHRLSRAGNRRINSVLHIMGQTQRRQKIPEALQCFTQHYHGPQDELKAMRALKRRLSDIIYRTMINDALTARTGPGGHQDHDSHSSAAGSQPHTDSSDKPLHGPATKQPKPTP